jgi:hypothetical protein
MHINPIGQFSLKWILITSLGWLVAQAFGILATRIAFSKVELAAVSTSPLYWVVFGVLFGLSQWIVLRDRIPRSFKWVIATAIGCFVAALIVKVLNRTETINSFLRAFSIFTHLFGGTVMGFSQYQVIKKSIQKANWWIFIVGTSWAFAQGFIGLNDIPIGLIGVLLFNAITGLGFAWLAQISFSEIEAT